MVASACGEAGRSATSTPAPGQPGADGGGSFPVSIEHKFGTTRIDRRPERVLSLGYQEHDTIFALGVAPVAVRYWFGSEADVIFPWAEAAAGTARPEILKMPYGELNYEKVTALRPDLILGVYSGITAPEYEKLARIAPTVAQTASYVDFGVPWQDTTRTVGRALGRAAQAEKLVADLEGRFRAVRDRHPGWQGRTVAVSTYRNSGGAYGFFASQDPRSRFFTSLGFVVPRALDDATGGKFFGEVSPERLSLLDADLVVWVQVAYVDGGRAAIMGDPLVGQMRSARERRQIFLEGDLENAFAFNSVLSLPFVLDGVVPMLEAAVRR
ncbi:MAG: iron-siderophore ABC transporter substrate-binding protein [Acidimicrobiales bacterium]